MKRIITILSLFFFVFSLSLKAQKEATWWYFGDRSAPTQLDSTPINRAQTFEVFVKACVLPVNPKIHLFKTD